ncbi:helix-turn-helix transcriptional regulator [Nitrospira sp. BLG_2]|uniref:helix-turn-helix transcriptional regulator n=1 Tax=Nitrospira sp. BLG_2 TaxID=3397507 RepID=UPI003B9942DD
MFLTEDASRAVTSTMEKTLVRVGEAAELLSVSRWTIYRWVEEGRLRGTKIGKGSLRIFRQSIVDLVENNESNSFSTFERAR